MVALLFPGQGSQRKGMGDGLFARFPELTRQADDILGYSVEELCRTSGEGRLDRTEYAQPALFVVGALTYLARDTGLPEPRFLAGHSLGEYGALFAAGCFDFATGVRLVRERGALMGRASGGGMLAVLGVDGAEVPGLLEETGAREVDVANFNAPTQTVLAGPLEELRQVSQALARRPGVRCVPVRVSAAFHSRHMRPAAQEFTRFLTGFSFADPRRTVVSSVTARPYRPGEVAEVLARQIAGPVRWAETMAYLDAHGVRQVEEVGPGQVLTGLWKRTYPSAGRGGPTAAAPGAAPRVPVPRGTDAPASTPTAPAGAVTATSAAPRGTVTAGAATPTAATPYGTVPAGAAAPTAAAPYSTATVGTQTATTPPPYGAATAGAAAPTAAAPYSTTPVGAPAATTPPPYGTVTAGAVAGARAGGPGAAGTAVADPPHPGTTSAAAPPRAVAAARTGVATAPPAAGPAAGAASVAGAVPTAGPVLSPVGGAARDGGAAGRPPRFPAPAAPSGPASGAPASGAEELGCAEFRREYGIRYAYLAGAMFRGIASAELVIRMGRAGLMGFFGAGGLTLEKVESALLRITDALGPDGRYGMNLLHSIDDPAYEQHLVDLYLRHQVHTVEAAGFTQLTPAVVRFRFVGAHRDGQGRPVAVRRVLAKVSRPEVANAFMGPPPEPILRQLVAEGRLTAREAEIAAELPVSQDICVEADSGGHTDGGAALTLLPAMIRHRDAAMARHRHARRIRVGAAGGIGSPEAVAAAFVLGADFVLTGSVNQCSPQAGTSDAVKDILAGLDVQDTAYAPAGDMFEIGAQVQVVRKGTLFAARGNKLYQLYRAHDGWESIDASTRRSIEDTYFKRPFAEVWEETRAYHLARGRAAEIEKAERLPKHRMALAFRWYFARSVRWGLEGDPAQKANYQIQCGPAIGAFNHVVRGTALENWRDRHVDLIAEHLMTGAAALLARRCAPRAAPPDVVDASTARSSS
ncbi:ACP S-malonyltransferase [Streptomyces sp. NPDC028635]|uniref:ACP S-malonyltransferase n=1 Tax=Streptomyces sp. NPDC028635 TaxID=3154800 RepID=UPI0033EEFC7F